MADLFGGPDPPPRPKHFAAGYAAQPGLGPFGETCRTCAHARVHEPNRKRYWKCNLVKPSASISTDIRLKSPACRRWERKS